MKKSIPELEEEMKIMKSNFRAVMTVMVFTLLTMITVASIVICSIIK